MSEANKPILCIDFDGVIHSYEHGWRNGEIYGTVVDGFFEWAHEANKSFQLCVYSSRSKTDTQRNEMMNWLEAQLRVWNDTHDDKKIHAGTFDYPRNKPPAWLTIDDRAIRFDGDWTDVALTPQLMRGFTPWNQRQMSNMSNKEKE